MVNAICAHKFRFSTFANIIYRRIFGNIMLLTYDVTDVVVHICSEMYFLIDYLTNNHMKSCKISKFEQTILWLFWSRMNWLKAPTSTNKNANKWWIHKWIDCFFGWNIHCCSKCYHFKIPLDRQCDNFQMKSIIVALRIALFHLMLVW